MSLLAFGVTGFTKNGLISFGKIFFGPQSFMFIWQCSKSFYGISCCVKIVNLLGHATLLNTEYGVNFEALKYK